MTELAVALLLALLSEHLIGINRSVVKTFVKESFLCATISDEDAQTVVDNLDYYNACYLHEDRIVQIAMDLHREGKITIEFGDLVVREVYRQQEWMYSKKVQRIDDRIVSLSQPHIRPIVRGKAGTPVEFGAKLSASVRDGYVFLDRISWDNFNEAGDLKAQTCCLL